MAGTNVELELLLRDTTDDTGKKIGQLWDNWSIKRNERIEQIKELRNYVFATDTRTTSNAALPWKNSTTLPKLCQLRDNLHANYISTIFPNDNWIKWEGKTASDATYVKKNAIQSYISTKANQSNLRDLVSQLLYDYIDTGMVFGTTNYVKESTFDPETNREISGYTGPRVERISVFDIVFNPVAPSFRQSPKIIRSIKTIGELTRMAQTDDVWVEAINKTKAVRRGSAAYTVEDFHKAAGFQIDGFGSLLDYYGTDYVEVLTFEGDFYNTETEELEENIQIIIIDKSILVTRRAIPSPLGKDRIFSVGWRKRPDNLYAMGPLDNLVGMQYRIDHLENLKADAMDLMIHPPLVIKGDVDPYVWGPNAEIHIASEDGEVKELGLNFAGVATANNEIAILEQKMEEYAGAPKQAMGIRTPGEKTAFEVQALENASGRIFLEKTINFEINALEPALNGMLADAISSGDVSEVVRTFDEEIGAEDFLNVTTADLMTEGLVRPIGARHFGQQAQILQNLSQALTGALGPVVAPHMSGKAIARLLEDSLQLQRYSLVRPYVALAEAAEGQKLGNALQEDVNVDQATPTQ